MTTVDLGRERGKTKDTQQSQMSCSLRPNKTEKMEVVVTGQPSRRVGELRRMFSASF